MHEMLTILTDVSQCLSVCLSHGLNRWHMQCTPSAVCVGSFGAAFTKFLWPLVVSYCFKSRVILAADK